MKAKIVEESGKYSVMSNVGIGWVYEGGKNGKLAFDTEDEAIAWCKRNDLDVEKA